MATKTSQTKRPQKIEQLYPGTDKAHWENTYKLKNAPSNLNNDYAHTRKLTSSKPKIETLSFTNFGFNIPEYAIINAIIIKYAYRLEAQVAGKYPKIAAPSIFTKNTGMTGTEQKGVTPTKNWQTKYINYYDTNRVLPTAKIINKDIFGCEFQFAKNTSTNEGYMYLSDIAITIKYTIPDFPVDLAMIGDGNGEFVKDHPFRFQAVVNNPDLADTPPVVEIDVPTGTTLNFVSITSDTLVKISDTKYQLTLARWGSSPTSIDVNVGTNYQDDIFYAVGTLYSGSMTVDTQRGSQIVTLEAVVPSTGQKTFTITEKRGNKTQSRSVTVIAQPTPIIDDVAVPMEKAIYAIQNTPFILPVQIPESMVGTTFYLHTDTTISILNGSSYTSVSSWFTIAANKFNSEGYCELTCKSSTTGIINITISDTNTSVPEQNSFVVKVVPEGYDAPRFVVMRLSSEESNRLGDGFNYTVEADMRITCLSSNIPAFVDYYRNFRIGVVNEIPSTLDLDRIFNACRNWSLGISVFNEFEKKSVDFTYNKDYPVFIIITGNYIDVAANLFEGEFGNLQIIESTRDDGNKVIFPIPIKDTINIDDESASGLVLPANAVSNNIIFYHLGLDDTFQGRSNVAVRGVGVKVTANSDSRSIISAQLKSPQGYTSERSVILDENPVHILGGATDRWGFTVSELADLSNFELELNISNIAGIENNVNIEKVELITYFIFYEKQLVDWIVEDENMAGFNVFLEDVEIPEGLKTTTKYLTVDGTDTNNAFRQNIREKDITVEFSIDECSIDEATATLQDITQKLITERDALYRPIPKRVEFSHYPGIYWEYILEDTIDAKAKGSHYDCKVKLTIPDGTAYNKEDITTGKSGRVAGLAKVNPTIMIIPTAAHIEITETFTDQKFFMSYSDWSSSDTVEIDCKNRKILLHKDDEIKDITVEADMNTDWFLLYNQFLFKEVGCVIQSVTWNERK